MILLIDNYDSFTYNLYQQISELGKAVEVVRNDSLTIEDIRKINPEAIVLSPGPGTPSEAGITVDVVRELYKEFPILGICLGHQSIGEAFGGKILRAANIMHGKLSTLAYEKKGLFESLDGNVEVMRYHSLIIDPNSLPKDLEVIAKSRDDREIMAIQHKNFPVYGLQFHPESIGTVLGSRIIESFLEQLDSIEV
ncbi:aminodeoxychorismate/anthranilate synthase component II [Lysinibacillus sp. SGAir0095]|uniref:aminodeoxychorismate/anthranilate synthase component II n=1 Tax=Lysinibacillus sp. SGAir0095 TaxID=2070463 RepID=UPI0010CCD4A8|nr:aminodeoxychorismate/anthranilate synthase component II [Lysinibacillus sp. SGAir0095]QCR32863.1 aminodeoxychorismate/anthranilate synthase component II [Lysinibacillus sp. SGAir0095]